MKLNNEKGMALAITLLIVVILVSLGAIFVLRAINEKNLVENELLSARAFYIAEGSTNSAMDTLDTLINTHMLNTVNGMNPQALLNLAQQHVVAGTGIDFLVATVLDNGNAEITKHPTLDQGNHSVTVNNYGSGNYTFNVILTEKQNPFASGPDQWDFPYYYRVESVGTSCKDGGACAVGSSQVARDIVLTGDFTVRVQRDNFAKYALFTNQQTLPNGTNVWFTNKTNFAGPLHTKGRYNIALAPSGSFEGTVEQVETTARFYNQGFPILMDADSNPGKDEPTFNGGFNRGVSAIALASAVQKQDMIDQARGGDTTPGNGIFVANNGTNLTGGIYVNGDSTLSMAVNGSDQAVYTITQGASTKTITVDRSLQQTTIDDGVTPVTYAGLPDGVDDVGTIIYADGNVSSFSGTVQKDTELTLASEGDISITNNVHYSNHTPAVGSPGQVGYVPPHANGEKNLLGMVSWNGDVRIGTAAPNDVDVHGTLLAQNGILQVDDYNDTVVGPRGTATMMGGVISDYYGAFGLFSGSTGNQLSGYGRNFVYDQRMLVGNAPPYFPSLNTFIAFTNDITDKLIWQEGGV